MTVLADTIFASRDFTAELTNAVETTISRARTPTPSSTDPRAGRRSEAETLAAEDKFDDPSSYRDMRILKCSL